MRKLLVDTFPDGHSCDVGQRSQGTGAGPVDDVAGPEVVIHVWFWAKEVVQQPGMQQESLERHVSSDAFGVIAGELKDVRTIAFCEFGKCSVELDDFVLEMVEHGLTHPIIVALSTDIPARRRFGDAVKTIYDSGDLNPVAFSHHLAVMVWVLMNVKNPDSSLLTRDPLPNTGHIVVVGSPQGGWTLKDWDGKPR